MALALAVGFATAQDLQPLPEVSGPVVDTTGSLTTDQIERLTSELRAFVQRKGSQIAIVFVPTTLPEAIEQYSIRLAEAVKVGRSKADDGVLIVVAVQDRKTRIEVGYGLEGAVPDIVANQIRREVMNPYFRVNDFYGGVRAGAAALMKRIDGEALPPPWQGGDARADQTSDPMQWIIIALAALFGFGGMLKRALGRVAASGIVATVIGGGAWLLSGVALFGGIAGALAFVFSLLLLGRVIDFRPGGGSGGWSTGAGRGGWSGGGGSWSGGGGSFGGGGASGSWDD